MKIKDNILKLYKKLTSFFSLEIWHLELSDLSKFKASLIKYLKVFIITVRGFGVDKVGMQATTLSFFSAMAFVPFIALIFAITKGFGISGRLEQLLYGYFNGQKEIINILLEFAYNVINTTQKGIFGIISFFFFIWTVVWLMLSVERSFNNIWKVSNVRSFGKRVAYYTLLLLVSPFLIMVFLTLALLYLHTVENYASGLNSYIPITSIFTWLIFYIAVVFVFTIMYKFIPNLKVKIFSAFNSSIIVSSVFVLMQLLYLETQILVTGLNAVYGVFAAVPLFLVWMNISWTIILFGAELSHAFQNVENYTFK